MCTQFSVNNLVNVIECLAKMIHPEYFEILNEIAQKFINFKYCNT